MSGTNTRLVAALFLLAPLTACAMDIAVSGLYPGKAIIEVNGGPPRALAVGETSPEGVKLLSASSDQAVVEYRGRRETLTFGAGTRLGAAPASVDAGIPSARLIANGQGHFFTTGTINGQSVRFLVDTGASMVVLSGKEARRLGLNYLYAPREMVQTANGTIPVHRVTLDTVRVGEIVLHDVGAAVIDGSLPAMLLGMSFLNRTEMKRDGDVMTLIKHY